MKLNKMTKQELVKLLVDNFKDEVGNLDLSRLNQTHPTCLLYTSPSPRDRQKSRMPSSA